MAFSFSSLPEHSFSRRPFINEPHLGSQRLPTGIKTKTLYATIKCEAREDSSPAESSLGNGNGKKLQIGSPVIVVEAPKMIKTAASVPCLRVNAGLVNAGDVGRIVSRKPKDVWAIRLSIGTYLIDGKYFKPLHLEE